MTGVPGDGRIQGSQRLLGLIGPSQPEKIALDLGWIAEETMMLPLEEQAYQPTAEATADQPMVTRTGRGLTIAGTRIALYQILDYLKAGWTPDQIQYLHRLTDAQMAGALDYVESHREEVEPEYERVLQRAEEIRRYWEEHDRTRRAEATALPGRPGQKELRAKLDAWKKRLSREP